MGEAMLVVLLAAAGRCDVRERKIPNRLIWSGWVLGLFISLWRDGLPGMIRCVLAVLVVMAIGYPLFLIRAVGAGDVKLLSVIGGVHGLCFLCTVSVIWLILSGIVSLAILLRNHILCERFFYVWHYFAAEKAGRTPYYLAERDGKKCTVILAPILAVAYILTLAGRWEGIC